MMASNLVVFMLAIDKAKVLAENIDFTGIEEIDIDFIGWIEGR